MMTGMGSPRGSRRRAAVAVAALLGLAVAVGAVLAAWRGRNGLQNSANLAQVVFGMLAVPGMAAGIVAWWRTSSAARRVLAPPDVARAKDVLAGLVAEQWETEAALRSLDDPTPMPVQWRLTARPGLMDHPGNIASGPLTFDGSSDRIAQFADRFRGLKRRRLVVLGGPGTGKTTLAVQLLLHLLGTRTDGEPIPVLLSVAGWDTDAHPRLHDWLAARLDADYPALRAGELGAGVPRALASRGEILPVLDGLDELPDAARRKVITALNRSLGTRDQLILTSRTREYARAVDAAGDVVTAAAVIKPKALTAAVAAGYIEARLPPEPAPGWKRLLATLREPLDRNGATAAVAEIVSTPLGLWLLCTTYLTAGDDPAVLLDRDGFATAAALRSHLLDRVIPALIASRPPSAEPGELFRPRRHHDPAKVREWLGALAYYLNRVPVGSGRGGTRDFAWWELARNAALFDPRTPAGHRRTGTYTLHGVTVGIGFAVVVGLLVGVPAREPVLGPVIGFLSGLAIGTSALIWPDNSPGFADLRLAGRVNALVRQLLSGIFTLTLPMSLILGTGVVIGSSARLGTAGIVRRLPVSAEIAATIGLVAGIVWASIRWAETPTPEGRASSPLANWRIDRSLNLLRIALVVLLGTAAGAVTTLIFARGLSAGDTTGLMSVVLTLTMCVEALASRHHAWPAYLLATYRSAGRHRLPRRLMVFLDDAHRLGLLRAVGPIYQFRHAELQDHLAAAHRPLPRFHRAVVVRDGEPVADL